MSELVQLQSDIALLGCDVQRAIHAADGNIAHLARDLCAVVVGVGVQ